MRKRIIGIFALASGVCAWAQIQTINNEQMSTARTKINSNFAYLDANKMRYRGTWSSGTTYASQDVVSYSGSTYISIQSSNLNQQPDTSALWWTAVGGTGSGGGGAWGSITGTLSNQTDLASALAGKASTTHATAHQNGGSDEVATATPGANAIPKAGSGGTLAAGWIPTLNQSTTGNAATASALAANGTNCSAGQYPLGVDASGNAEGCTVAGSVGGGSLVVSTGAGTPSANCTAPSTSNLAVYDDTTNGDVWWCYATNQWKKIISTTGTGVYIVTGQTGSAPATPASGYVSCYFSSTTGMQVCLDSSGNASTTVRGTTATTNQFLTHIGADGIQVKAHPSCGNLSNAAASCSTDTTVASNITSGTLPAARLPSPSASALGGVQSKTCSAGDFVSELTTGGVLTCTTPTGGGGGTGVGRTSATVNFASAIPDGGWAAQTFTWTGVTTADTIILGPPSGLAAGLEAIGYVSAADTVTVRLANNSGAAITPGGATWKAVLAVYNLSGSGTIDFGSVPDGGYLSSTFTLTGVAAGDPLAPKWPDTLEAGITGSMVATAPDTVRVTVKNNSGAALDLASHSYGASIAK